MKAPTLGAKIAAMAAAICLTLSACGGAASSSQSGGGAAGPTADIKRAKAAIAGYVGHPSPFPIDTPLVRKPTGKRIALVDCGTTICGLFYTLAKPAAKALGVKLTRIKATMAADSVAGAFDTIVQDKYDGVFVPAIPMPLWQASLDKLNAAHIPVVTAGITGTDRSKIPVAAFDTDAIDRSAKLLVDYVITQHGNDTNVVFYNTPELAFSNLLQKRFVSEIATLCPRCKVRTAKIPAAAFGTTAPSVVVDDLQANPDTETAVFAVGEQAAGLPAALKTAGLSVEVIANSPDPLSLQYIKDGDFSAGLGSDLPVIAWTLMDSLARLSTGQKPAPGAVADVIPQQFLTRKELTGDVSHSWVAYPDYAKRFAALWSAAS
ncbi:sugar ABC transporter substrate-binding protein [Streptomyces malaysiensis]|uniref:sugar ABC transporter substrate-binding protein n=1 Tax=Streptomyces malaysiensis TaxID=92644 RepID=UPI00131B3FA1|nr:substrate-binding domain-containing protein [Streptomyces malaysiensis]